MTKEVRRRKVKIVDRVMINDLLVYDGQVVSIPVRWSSKNLVQGGGLLGGSCQPGGIGINALNEVVRIVPAY